MGKQALKTVSSSLHVLTWITSCEEYEVNTIRFLSLTHPIPESILLNFSYQNVEASMLTLPSYQTLTDKKARSHSRSMARYKVRKLHTTHPS